MAAIWGIVIAGWLCSAIVGGIIGSGRNRAGVGFALGLLFGPLGAIAAFALDGRARCPQCWNRIDEGVTICSTCHAELGWFHGAVGVASQVTDWVRNQEEANAAAARMAKLREDDSDRRQVEFNRWCGLVTRSLWSIACGALRLTIVAPLTALNRFLFMMADGSTVAYRILQVLWFLLLPLVVFGGITCIARSGKKPLPEAAAGHRVEDQAPAADIRRPRMQSPEEQIAAPPPDRVQQIPRPPGEPAVPDAEDLPGTNAKKQSRVALTPEEQVAPVDHPAFPEPPLEPALNAPRPIAVDGGEIAERVAEAEDRARKKARITAIENEIEQLSKNRRAIQDQSRARAAEDAYNARLGVRAFGGDSPENTQQRYKRETEVLFEKMRLLRAEMNALKREAARERRP